MRYVINERNWGLQVGNAVCNARNGDEIVVPNKTVERFAKDLIRNNYPTLKVDVKLKEQEDG